MTELRKTPKERPILYSAPMVIAYLDGRKTQTRRVIKKQPKGYPGSWAGDEVDPEPTWFDGYRIGREPCGAPTEEVNDPMRCPCGKPGDRLWGRETWALESLPGDGDQLIWRADMAAVWRADPQEVFYLSSDYAPAKWSPSIFMPRWASRMLADVVSVRVERVQDISEADAKAEGVYSWAQGPEGGKFLDKVGVAICARPRLLFELLWVSINGQESWDANPWVWVVEFKRCEASK